MLRKIINVLKVSKNLLNLFSNAKYGFCTYQAKLLIRSIFSKKATKDDFDWSLYTDHYKEELKHVAKKHTIILNPGDYEFLDNRIILRRNIMPLHPNYRLVYETILQLGAESVLEAGCGRGDHIHNISLLLPCAKLYGLDISRKQIDYLHWTYPDLKAAISQIDLTSSSVRMKMPTVDLAFTQAVLMHIRNENGYLMALENIFRAVNKQVILMENWRKHEFMEDIKLLFDQRRIPWRNMHFYYRVSEELKRPHLMIISSQPLPQYPGLEDYSLLRENTDNTVDYGTIGGS